MIFMLFYRTVIFLEGFAIYVTFGQSSVVMTNKEWKRTRKKFSQKPRKKSSAYIRYTQTHIYILYFKVYNISPPLVSQDFLLDLGKGWMHQKCYASFVQMIHDFYTKSIHKHTYARTQFFYTHPIVIRMVAWGEFPISNRLIFSMGFHIKINRPKRSERISGFQSFSILELYKFALHTGRERERAEKW